MHITIFKNVIYFKYVNVITRTTTTINGVLVQTCLRLDKERSSKRPSHTLLNEFIKAIFTESLSEKIPTVIYYNFNKNNNSSESSLSKTIILSIFSTLGLIL